jgi:hypothetical protein
MMTFLDSRATIKRQGMGWFERFTKTVTYGRDFLYSSSKKQLLLGMVVHAYNPRTQDAEADWKFQASSTVRPCLKNETKQKTHHLLLLLFIMKR